MATNCSDVIETLSALLRTKGYAIHNGDAESGETVSDESGADWWFTWAAPGMADCESGDTCASSLDAEADALVHWFSNAVIHLDRAGDAPRLDVAGILSRCESFISGFEDDSLQEGIPELLAEVRGAIETTTEADLCAELREFCQSQGLPYESADELASGDQVNESQRAALLDYVKRWDAFQDSRRVEVAGPFYVMTDHEQSIGCYDTRAEAETAARAARDAEPLRVHFSVYGNDGAEWVADIGWSEPGETPRHLLAPGCVGEADADAHNARRC